MPQARRKSRPGSRPRLAPGWVLLALGLLVGIASVLLLQLIMGPRTKNDGLPALLSRAKPPAEAPAPKPPPAAAPKPKFDFYTVLPEIETVLPERDPAGRSPRPAATDRAKYVLQAGAFAQFEDADQLKAKLALQGLVAQIQRVSIEGKGEYHRVRLGPYDRLEDLDAANQRLRALGITPLRLKVKPAP